MKYTIVQQCEAWAPPRPIRRRRATLSSYSQSRVHTQDLNLDDFKALRPNDSQSNYVDLMCFRTSTRIAELNYLNSCKPNHPTPLQKKRDGAKATNLVPPTLPRNSPSCSLDLLAQVIQPFRP
jgi:hypothetical protein